MIEAVRAWECLDSRGHPTVGCLVRLEGGAEGVALVPTGASTGRHEVAEWRDGGSRFRGLGVARAVAHVEEVLAPMLLGRDPAEVDALVHGPTNATLAVSVAARKAAAAARGYDLWADLAEALPVGVSASLPCPMVNIFSGGRHAGGAVAIQDYLAVPLRAASFAEAVEQVWEVRARARELLAQAEPRAAALVADEGGLALSSTDQEAPLAMLAAAIADTGLTVGIAIDVAATQIPAGIDPVALIEQWRARYPLVSVEDPLGDDDWDGWAVATARLAGLQVVGDDFFATNAARVEEAARRGVANAVLLKPNQIGTLAGAEAALAAARANGYATIVSARSGDTEDDVIADLAVGWAAGQIKIGSLTRSERLAKYNRLLRLEAVAGLPYAGWAPR